MEERERAFGHNRKPVIEPKGYCELLYEALSDFTLRILIFAALVSIAVDVGTADEEYRRIAWIEGTVGCAILRCRHSCSRHDIG